MDILVCYKILIINGSIVVFVFIFFLSKLLYNLVSVRPDEEIWITLFTLNRGLILKNILLPNEHLLYNSLGSSAMLKFRGLFFFLYWLIVKPTMLIYYALVWTMSKGVGGGVTSWIKPSQYQIELQGLNVEQLLLIPFALFSDLAYDACPNSYFQVALRKCLKYFKYLLDQPPDLWAI